MEKGKWRVEDKGKGKGTSKRPKVGPMALEGTEGEVPQVGSQVVEALWALNTCVGDIQAKLVASREVTSESVQLLCCLLIYNMHQIELTSVVWRE